MIYVEEDILFSFFRREDILISNSIRLHSNSSNQKNNPSLFQFLRTLIIVGDLKSSLLEKLKILFPEFMGKDWKTWMRIKLKLNQYHKE
jgi:hypothetical protein